MLAFANPQFAEVVKILRAADHGFANQEGSIFDLAAFKGYPAAENGGGNPLAIPAVARDLKNMGIDMVSKPTITRQIGAPKDCSKRSESWMRPGSRTQAADEAASTFTPMSIAGAIGSEVPGRPGISVLRTRRITLVTPAEIAALRTIAAREGRTPASDAKAVTVNGQAYRVSDQPGLTYEMNPYDRFEILKAIRGAKQVSAFVVFAIHAHETASGEGDDRRPGDFLPVLFHNVIDAGADMVVTTGPHVLHGVEIYKGKPIFYGLASLFFKMEVGEATDPDILESINLDVRPLTYPEYVRARFPGFSPTWFDGVVAVSEFQGVQVKQVRLYPLTLNRERGPRPQGTPKLASGADAERILKQLQHDSEPFGTNIRIENSTGIIDVAH